MKLSAKAIAPAVVLLVATAVMGVMIANRPEARSTRLAVRAPLVEVVAVHPASLALPVVAQGSVEPRTESELVSEVSGRIVWTSPQLASGGFFAEGAVLARIDPRDFEIALEGARAALARAESNLRHASANLERQRSMGQTGASSQARLDDAIHAESSAAAGVREARVAVQRAELDLERSEIRAPYAGRVREKYVDIGQFLARGVRVARVYAVDYAEVRLPIHDADLAFLDLPAHTSGGAQPSSSTEPPLEDELGPVVRLSAEYAGERQTWTGRIVRIEGALDARSRMAHVVARIEDPYRRSNGPPLPVGLFVEAEIAGRTLDGVFEIPRSALRRRDEVLVVDGEERLHLRRVAVLRSDRRHSWIQSGLTSGERVVTTPLEVVTEGMQVRSRLVDPDGQNAAASPEPMEESPLAQLGRGTHGS